MKKLSFAFITIALQWAMVYVIGAIITGTWIISDWPVLGQVFYYGLMTVLSIETTLKTLKP